MERSYSVIGLSILVLLLVLVATGTGLFWQQGTGPFDFTTLRGTTVSIYGQGIYQYDTVFSGAGFRGQDAVALLLGVPLLALSLVLYARHSLQGGLLLLGMLGYFLYVYTTMALAAAYNQLFFVYVGIWSASLFSFVRLFTSMDARTVYEPLSNRLPHRGVGVFMIVSGLLTLYVWAAPLCEGLLQNRTPDRLDSYTTFVTVALDLAIITPSVLLSGVLILQRKPFGYLVAFPLLTLIVMLLPTIILNTVLQIAAGINFTIPEIVGPITGFAVLGTIAVWIVAMILRMVVAPAELQPVQA